MSGTQERRGAWASTTPVPVSQSGGEALKSVASALDVLELFASDQQLGVSDIARRLGIAKSTAHRLLSTLASRGFVEQEPETGQYRLGLHIYELGQLAQARHALRYVALPVLRQLARSLQVSVNFSVPVTGGDVVFVERIEMAGGAKVLLHAGRRLPAHTSSSGKAIAAFNEDFDRQRRAAGFPPRLRNTIRTECDWDQVLREVRRFGYAHAEGESYARMASVAVPIRGRRTGVAVAAVSVFGEIDTIRPRAETHARVLTEAAHRIADLAGVA